MAEITIRISDKTVKLSVALLVIVLFVWGFSRFGSWDVFRPKYEIQMFVPKLSGLQVGAPVTLNAIPVGSVSAVNLAENSEGPGRSVRVTLRIQKRFQEMIRDDSTASVTTQGLLGQPYVEIHRGYAGSLIKFGGEIRVIPVKPFSFTDFTEALKNAAGCQNEGKNAPTPTGPPNSKK